MASAIAPARACIDVLPAYAASFARQRSELQRRPRVGRAHRCNSAAPICGRRLSRPHGSRYAPCNNDNTQGGRHEENTRCDFCVMRAVLAVQRLRDGRAAARQAGSGRHVVRAAGADPAADRGRDRARPAAGRRARDRAARQARAFRNLRLPRQGRRRADARRRDLQHRVDDQADGGGRGAAALRAGPAADRRSGVEIFSAIRQAAGRGARREEGDHRRARSRRRVRSRSRICSGTRRAWSMAAAAPRRCTSSSRAAARRRPTA